MKEFFKNSQDALVWCCKQGTMGNIYYDNSENPHSATAVLAILLILTESLPKILRFFGLQVQRKIIGFSFLPIENGKKF